MSAGFSGGPRLYQVLEGIDGFPLDETVRRGWKDYRVRVSRSQTDAPLLKIGVAHGLPGALFMAASLVEGLTDYRGDRGLLESDPNGFPSVTRNPLAKTLDPNMFNDDIEDLRMALLDSCDFPSEAQYDELFWIKENASRLVFDKASKKWGMRVR